MGSTTTVCFTFLTIVSRISFDICKHISVRQLPIICYFHASCIRIVKQRSRRFRRWPGNPCRLPLLFIWHVSSDFWINVIFILAFVFFTHPRCIISQHISHIIAWHGTASPIAKPAFTTAYYMLAALYKAAVDGNEASFLTIIRPS